MTDASAFASAPQLSAPKPLLTREQLRRAGVAGAIGGVFGAIAAIASALGVLMIMIGAHDFATSSGPDAYGVPLGVAAIVVGALLGFIGLFTAVLMLRGVLGWWRAIAAQLLANVLTTLALTVYGAVTALVVSAIVQGAHGGTIAVAAPDGALSILVTIIVIAVLALVVGALVGAFATRLFARLLRPAHSVAFSPSVVDPA